MLIPVLTGISEATKAQNSYYTCEGCTGCGTCERVCLSGKIRLADKKPVWQKSIRCFNCEACINYCPQAVIQIKDSPFLKFNTVTNGRYTHPYATIEEIAAQKENKG
jgi:ferredoxin